MSLSHFLTLLFLQLLLLCLLPPALQASNAGPHQFSSLSDRVYLVTVPALTFTTQALTTARRGTPRPQLHCAVGDACKNPDLIPERVDCYNLGIDESAGQSSQHQSMPKWHCVTALHRDVRMQNWRVKCEGYSYENDAYVLRGSCWLDFELVYAQQDGDGERNDEGDHGASGEKSGQSSAARRFWSALRNLFVASLGVALLVWWCRRGEGGRAGESVSEAERLLANVNTDGYTDRTSAR